MTTTASYFKGAEIRRVCHNDEWWYSITDVIGALIGTDRASKYWTDLKTKLIENEGFSELSDKIGKLPLPGADGKKRPAEVATPETLFRVIQSIPSPKVERIKRWLAKVGYGASSANGTHANRPDIRLRLKAYAGPLPESSAARATEDIRLLPKSEAGPRPLMTPLVCSLTTW